MEGGGRCGGVCGGGGRGKRSLFDGYTALERAGLCVSVCGVNWPIAPETCIAERRRGGVYQPLCRSSGAETSILKDSVSLSLLNSCFLRLSQSFNVR